MDYELLFWIVAPVALPLLVLVWSALRMRAEDRKREWNKLHADDFNKDIWEESWT